MGPYPSRVDGRRAYLLHSRLMDKVFRLLRSLKLTLVLVSLLAVGCALSTLVPQGLAPEWYDANYSSFTAGLVRFTGLSRFFVSPAFIVLVVLFWINLFSCTVHRFSGQLKLRLSGYYGPDLLHAGILILVAAASGSAFFRASASVELAAGEGAEFPGAVYVQVIKLEALAHEDGRPKDWITTVRFAVSGQSLWKDAVIRVNHPMRAGKLRFYQYSWKRGLTLEVTKDGETLRLAPGASAFFASGLAVRWAGTGKDSASGATRYGLVLDGVMYTLATGESAAGVQVGTVADLEDRKSVV